jgi:hypothetical protein
VSQEEQRRRDRNPPIDASLVIDTRLLAIEREQTEEKRRDQEYKKRQLRLTELLVGATILYVIVTAFIAYKSMVSADAAITAIGVARDHFRQEQRPYIWVSNFGAPEFIPQRGDPKSQTGQVLWTWHFTNYGKTPAHKTTSELYIQLGTGQMKLGHGYSEQKQIGVPVPPGADYFRTVVSDPVTRDEFNRLFVTEGIRIKAHYTYTDAGGTPYESEFCLVHLNSGSISFCEPGYIK